MAEVCGGDFRASKMILFLNSVSNESRCKILPPSPMSLRQLPDRSSISTAGFRIKCWLKKE